MKRAHVLLALALLVLPPIFSWADSTLDEKYKAGVKSFLEGNSQQAIALLSDVVKEDAANEKAKTLLLKLYMKEINSAVLAKKYTEAKRLHRAALVQFPDDQGLILLGASVSAPVEAVHAAPAPAAPAPVQGVERKAKPAMNLAPVRRTTEEKKPAPPVIEENPPAPARPIPAATMEKPGFMSFLWLAVGSVIFILVVGFIFVLILDRKKLWEKIETHERRLLKKEETEKARENEIAELKVRLSQKEEMLRIKNEELEHAHQKLEEKQKDRPRGGAFPSLPLPGRGAPSSAAPAVRAFPSARAAQSYAHHQEQRILDIVVDAPSLVKREAWERIAERTLTLYETSASEAILFLKKLADDEKPVVRMSIIMALSRIAVPETLDMMLAMLKDRDFDVQREAIKGLKSILIEKAGSIAPEYRDKISSLLNHEVEEGGWVV
jgi:hypothetical protein